LPSRTAFLERIQLNSTDCNMDLNIKDKIIIVTGGAKGIGEGISRAIANEGGIPVIAGRSSDAAENLVRDLAGKGLKVHKILGRIIQRPKLQTSGARNFRGIWPDRWLGEQMRESMMELAYKTEDLNYSRNLWIIFTIITTWHTMPWTI